MAISVIIIVLVILVFILVLILVINIIIIIIITINIIIIITIVTIISQLLTGDSRVQPCQNVLAAGNFTAFSPFLDAYSTLDYTMNPLAGKGTWCLLPTTPSMLPTATKHFDGTEGLSIQPGPGQFV